MSVCGHRRTGDDDALFVFRISFMIHFVHLLVCLAKDTDWENDSQCLCSGRPSIGHMIGSDEYSKTQPFYCSSGICPGPPG